MYTAVVNTVNSHTHAHLAFVCLGPSWVAVRGSEEAPFAVCKPSHGILHLLPASKVRPNMHSECSCLLLCCCFCCFCCLCSFCCCCSLGDGGSNSSSSRSSCLACWQGCSSSVVTHCGVLWTGSSALMRSLC